MGTKKISISEEAYDRLSALKKPGESFTDVVNRLTRKRSIIELTRILELAGTLTEEEGEEIRRNIEEPREASFKRDRPTGSHVE